MALDNCHSRLTTENRLFLIISHLSSRLPLPPPFFQVAVALSHASILEESMRARQQLAEQNVALDNARAEAERAIRARNDFLAVMNHEMRTPMHAIIALSTLLQVGCTDRT